jgi:carbonic anhydrase
LVQGLSFPGRFPNIPCNAQRVGAILGQRKKKLMITAQEALVRLQTGNQRFVSDTCNRATLSTRARRCELASGQAPFAVILGCSDSRVPAEIIFDQGLGDLFVIRVAGNIVAPSQVGSIELAVERYGTPLVVVLGHSCCGAIAATIEELSHPSKCPSRNLGSILNRIRPALEHLLPAPPGHDPQALIREAVRANIRASASQLRHGASEVLERCLCSNHVLIIGAEYSLESGEVDFFDGLPEAC